MDGINIKNIGPVLKKNKFLNKIIILDKTGSTNRYLAEGKFTSGTIALAKKQVSGMGRRGKKWESPEGGLWFSCLLNKKKKNPFYHVMCASAGVLCAMRRYGAAAKIKWPNDIIIKEKKACGILAENDYYTGRVITGIGINVNNPVPRGTDTAAVSLRCVLKKKINTGKMFLSVIREIDRNFSLPEKKVREYWLKNLTGVAGRQIKFVKNGNTFSGTGEGTGKSGVVVSLKNGKKTEIKPGDFTI